jgi:multiple sugar transport system substrate-binding protein
VAFGGSFLAIARAASAEEKALAWALIQRLTLDPAVQLASFRAHDAFPALLATHDDPFFAEPLPLFAGQPARLLWRETACRIRAVAVHKQDAFADEVLNTALDQVLDRGQDIAPALADAAQVLQRRALR